MPPAVITYTPESLIINLPTSCAEGLHRQIITGLITAIKSGLITPCNPTEKDALTVLADVLNKIIPTSGELADAKKPA